MRVLALIALIIALPASAAAEVRHDEGIGAYVGIDGRQTIPTGVYAGLADPNANRLTFLFDHGDHFHGIGVYSYTGPAGAPSILPTSTNNRLPEITSGENPLPLTAGSGLYAGLLRSMAGASEYSYLGMASIHTLAGFAAGSEESILFGSSSGRWNGPLSGIDLGLQLLAATPGLHIGSGSVLDLFAGGDTISLGAADAFEFDPIYWTDDAAAPGTYSAMFRLIDLTAGSQIGSSGQFNVDFEVAAIPEPSSWVMFLAGLGLLGVVARRRA